MSKIIVRKLSDYSLLVGKKIVQIHPNGNMEAVTELTEYEQNALTDYAVENELITD